MSDSDEFTPPNIQESANEAVSRLIPQKSRDRYERNFKIFMDWCRLQSIRKYTENVMLAYFEQFKSKKSLWSVYSMIKLCLITYENVDISKYSKLIAYLKRMTEHHKPKKSKFLGEAPDCSYLMMKVAK